MVPQRAEVTVPGAPVRRQWGWIAVGLMALAVQLGGDAAALALRYERAGILDGEVWRLLTGHLVHLSPYHLALNLLGMALVAAYGAGCFTAAGWLAIGLGCALATGGGLLWLSPEVGWYVGLSGALHGLLAAVGFARVRRHEWSAGLLLGGVALKLAWEQLYGPLTEGARIGGAVIVDAHLYGTIGGAVAAGLWLVWQGRRGRA